MTTTIEREEPTSGPGPDDGPDSPRPIKPGLPTADRLFRGIARSAGILVLAIMGGIGVFLLLESTQAFEAFGWSFFTESDWNPETGKLGIVAVLTGTITIALIAMVIAFPLALATALYISEYAPPRAKKTLIAMVDLMAAVPSVVYGLWGVVLLQENIVYVSHWLHQVFGSWLPIFDADTDPNKADWAEATYTSSPFVAGVVVSLMVLPFACSMMREVFAQAPPGEREAALALGSTRWGMIRSVVLPFGRGGIIGGTMLALGRALGETIAVALIISPLFEVKIQVLENGGISISSLIAMRHNESSALQMSALMAAGLVLYVFTLIINSLAAMVVNRSRSGATTEI